MSSTYFNISDKLRLYEFDGMLDQYGDAAAAYSLRKLRSGYTGDAIRVRRSSDDTERDMGFYDNELDTQALLDWVNTEYVKYTSDFSSDNEGWSAAGGTSDGNIDGIDGQDDCLRLTADTSTGNHRLSRANLFRDRPNSFRIELDYYIPSANIDANSIKILTSGGNTDFLDVLDTWTSATLDTGTVPSGYFYITMYASGTNLFTGNGSDVIYVKNIRVTQTTSSGHVHTWYDQSANANHAVQGTDTAQPKIVDAGSLVKEGGKPAITMDGVDDRFLLTSSITSTDYSVLTTLNLDDTFQTSLYGGIINESLGSTNGFIYHHGQGYNWRDAGSYHKLVHPVSETGQHLLFMTVNSTTGNGYINGQLSNTNVSITNNNLTFGELFGDAFGNAIKANVQELVLYTEYRQGEQDNFMFNANTYYNIY